MEKEGTQDGPKTGGILSRDSDSCRLYFKGLIREDTRGFFAGFGVAICRQEDDSLLFQMKGSLHDSSITVLEVELMALKRGLTEAVSLGIPHISICCDHDQIFELVLGRSVPEKDSIALLMDDVERIRQQLTSSTPVLVTGNQTKIAYKLAMETLVSEISISMPPTCGMVCADDQKKKKLAWGMCFEEDFEAEQMFYVALCRHQFCVECMKRHVEESLLQGDLMRCPRLGCNSKLTIKSCAHLLAPNLRAIWEDRIKVGSTITAWRECKKCQRMVETDRSKDYDYITCSCGHSFCKDCGVEWKHPGCRHRQTMIFTGIFTVFLVMGLRA